MCEENYFSFCLEYLFLTFCVNRHITNRNFFLSSIVLTSFHLKIMVPGQEFIGLLYLVSEASKLF